VNVKSNGEVLLDKRKITVEQLPDLLLKAQAIDPSTDAIINADKDVSHGAVMQIVDAFRKLGMERVAIGVEGK